MADETVIDYCRKQLTALKNDLSSFIPHYRDISEMVSPRTSRFLVEDVGKGAKFNMKILDNTATLASRTMTSGLMSGVTSPARPWFRLTIPDLDKMDYQPVKSFLSEVANRMRSVFARSNLYTALPVTYGQVGNYGTAAIVPDRDLRSLVRFYPLPVGSFCLAQSSRLSVDTLYREFTMTVRQLVDEYGIDNVSSNVRSAYNGRILETRIPVCHAIEPNVDRVPGKLDAKNKQFRSITFESNASPGAGLLRHSGFDTFRAFCPRWGVNGEDVYGTVDVPGMIALGDIKQLQLVNRRKIEIMDKGSKPPLNAPAHLLNLGASILPGAVNYITGPPGMAGVTPAYEPDPQWIAVLRDDIADVRDRINRAYFVDLFLMISQLDRADSPTAREIAERHEEKLLAIGPVLDRFNSELYDPLIEFTFDAMLDADLVPEPPEELDGEELRVEYISIMHQAQRMVGTQAVERLWSFAGSLAAVKPECLDKLDADQSVDEMGEMLGVSPKIVVADDQVAKIRAARKEQENLAKLAAAAQPVMQGAQAAKVLSDTKINEENALTRALGVSQ